MFFGELQNSIEQHNLDVEGCSIEEIICIENKLNIELPKAYKDFLMLMGKNAGPIFCGNNYEIYELISLQKEANEILYRRTGTNLTKEVFVFSIHQNYAFQFFKLNENDNPKTYIFIEPEIPSEIKEGSKTFTDLINKQLSSYLKCKEEKSNRNKVEKEIFSNSILKNNIIERIGLAIMLFLIIYFLFS